MTAKKPTILIVDDEKVILDNFSEFFKTQGWHTLKAPHGRAALTALKRRKWDCDCIILDQRMPAMDGLTFLQKLRSLEPPKTEIPVIVLSAYVDRHSATGTSFNRFGAKHIIQKPQEPDLLEAVARAIVASSLSDRHAQSIAHAITAHELDERIKEHEALIARHYRKRIAVTNPVFRNIKEPLFLVARRWNSWYPSYYDVLGGAYATVFPTCAENGRLRGTVIDPGFRFLRILEEEFGLSVRDLETCIITHNHPDHVGGVFEYIACRFEADQATTFYCNGSTQRMLSVLASPNISSCLLPGNGKEEIILNYQDKSRNYRLLGVRTFATDHREAGWDSDSRGLILSSHSGAKPGGGDMSYTTVILGDTAYDEANHDMDFPRILSSDANTKIAVLHVGSAQIKQRAGGHLYLTGLTRLVHGLAAELDKMKRHRKNKLVVLVSEWGLEHASADQIEAICPELTGFDKASAIISTIDFLRNSLRDHGRDRLVLLPADVGLMVGMESGKIYLQGQSNRLRLVSADKVTFKAGRHGIEYC
jgi:CheY-like chemotaxis protein